MWGGATFDTAMRFLHEDPWLRLRQLRERIPEHLFPDAVPRLERGGLFQLSRQRRGRFREARGRAGIDIFRIFDSLNYTPNLKVAMEAVQETHAVCEAAICYTGDILDPKRDEVFAEVLRQAREGTGKMGAHFLAIKDMAGLCRPLRGASSWSRRSRRKSASRSISTRTTQRHRPRHRAEAAKRAWTSPTWRSPRCPAPPASRT
jgi:pyruvate carboxylase